MHISRLVFPCDSSVWTPGLDKVRAQRLDTSPRIGINICMGKVAVPRSRHEALTETGALGLNTKPP